MRIAHWSLFAPNQSGMYHTTKDMIEGQRALGIDSELVCMNATATGGQRDGAFTTVPATYCSLSDVYCLHSRVDSPYWGDGTPIVFVAHGQPQYTWQTELYGLEPGNPKPWSTSLYYFRAPEVSRVVTFWRDQLPYWKALDGPRYEERVRFVPRGIVFGDRWSPDGPTMGLPGEPVLIIADSLRLCKDWSAIMFAAAIFAKRHPGARLHMFGIPDPGNRIGDAVRETVDNSDLRHTIASVNPITDKLETAFRSGDILLSAVRGESRVAIEAAACGMEVVTQSCAHTWEADFRDPEAVAETIEAAWEKRQSIGREKRRQELAAETRNLYDIRRTAEGMKAVYEELL